MAMVIPCQQGEEFRTLPPHNCFGELIGLTAVTRGSIRRRIGDGSGIQCRPLLSDGPHSNANAENLALVLWRAVHSDRPCSLPGDNANSSIRQPMRRAAAAAAVIGPSKAVTLLMR